MSFSNFNNSFPQGSQLQDCSAGSPIGGVDSNNIFRLLHLTANGNIAVQSAATQVNTYYSVLGGVAATSGATGLKAAGVILAYQNVVYDLVTGVYTFRPYFLQDQNTGGAVNQVLVKEFSILDTYINTRIVGSDAFTPSITDFSAGVGAIWHNLVMQDIGTGSTSFALNTTNNVDNMEQTAYLTAGNYKLLTFVHTAITTGPTATNYSGLQYINQIA